MREDDGEHVPKRYGRDRVTAMVVDPGRALVYWEVTGDGLAAARARLPEDDRETAVPILRVYDVTDRIFDGSNAHGWVDHPIGSEECRRFIDVDRPDSVVVVDVGLRGASGRFARVARSRRAELPHRRPADGGVVTWMTVAEDGRPIDAEEPSPAWPRTAVPTPPPPGGVRNQPPTLGGASEWSFARRGD